MLTLAQVAYQAYAELTGWRLPPFQALPEVSQRAWEAAARAVIEAFLQSSRQRRGVPRAEEETPCP